MSARKKTKARTKPPKLPPFKGADKNEARWTSHTSVSDLREFASDLRLATDSLLFFLSHDRRPLGDIAIALGRITNVREYLEFELRFAEKQLAGGAS